MDICGKETPRSLKEVHQLVVLSFYVFSGILFPSTFFSKKAKGRG